MTPMKSYGARSKAMSCAGLGQAVNLLGRDLFRRPAPWRPAAVKRFLAAGFHSIHPGGFRTDHFAKKRLEGYDSNTYQPGYIPIGELSRSGHGSIWPRLRRVIDAR